MKALTIAATLYIFFSVALAKPAPVNLAIPVLGSADINIDTNVSEGASARGQIYFQVHQRPFNSDSFRCQIKAVLFNTTRLTRLCR